MIITLCGSARFETQFKDWNKRLGLAGHACFSLSAYPSDQQLETAPAGRVVPRLADGALPPPKPHEWYTPEQKIMLDLVHLAKISASDAILVLNIDGYVGDSTRREVAWARIQDKELYWLEITKTDLFREGDRDPHWLLS